MSTKISLIVLCITINCLGFSQTLSYVHYDIKDGLAGSTVYDLCQDNDGFLWLATNNGLSRFDGTNFKNFTVDDGLPDNEVLKVLADSEGRIWIGTFSKEICYYFNGKIYNGENDTLIKKIKLSNSIHSIMEDNSGNIIVNDQKNLIEISKKNQVIYLSDLPLLSRYKNSLAAFPDYFDGGLCVITKDTVFKYYQDRLRYFYKVPRKIDRTYVEAKLYTSGERIKINAPSPVIGFRSNRQYTVQYIGTINGAWEIDTVNFSFKGQFLKGKKISAIIEDSEKNVWFATFGEGVFKLSSKNIKTLIFDHDQGSSNTEVFSLENHQNYLLAGLGFGKAELVDKNSFDKNIKNVRTLSFLNKKYSSNRLFASKALASGVFILGFDSYLVKNTKNGSIYRDIYPVKSIAEMNDKYILVSTSLFVFKIRVRDLKIIDTLWRERSTKVFFNNNAYYIGTLKGLYKVNPDKSYTYFANIHPFLGRRINDIKASADGVLWVATNDKGIIAIKNDSLVALVNQTTGLSSNICKTLFIQNNELWAGTNRGVDRIDLCDLKRPFVKFSALDGLPSDNINAIYADHEKIWLGSPEGLTYFDTGEISNLSACNLKILGLSVSGRDMEIKRSYKFSYKNNNITFEYVGVSLKSGGDIVYHYKLTGFDKVWKDTKQTTLTYQSLPAGQYVLQLQAINKFGVKSELNEITFSISQPIWKTSWFYLFLLLSSILSTALIVNKRNKKIHAISEEKNKVERQFALLEQQALQAQMNPHFIFNCLNSLQQYILKNDKESANKYLSDFATLVRLTLDYSSKKTITIEEEVHYLKSYLEIEKTRFENKFEYHFNIETPFLVNDIEIPALLLQPYVENSIRHGIRNRKNGDGVIAISFSCRDNVLICTIRDNGVGRRKASELKTHQHIEYQSKGMSLTGKRIALLNKIYGKRLSVEVIDLKDANETDAGTEILVKMPI